MVTKKTTKKAVVKKTVSKKATPIVEPVTTGCGCGCKCGCHGHFIKKFIILLFMFLLGAVSTYYLCKPHMHIIKQHIKFDDNGCLMMDTIKSPKFAEIVAKADFNTDGCISREEFRALRRAAHQARQKTENK
ncbi:MAG: hypothetical protein MJ152_04235 [Clostridia bacterium]|nr:hypothetical protein [Clostridia bacterium]